MEPFLTYSKVRGIYIHCRGEKKKEISENLANMYIQNFKPFAQSDRVAVDQYSVWTYGHINT